MTDFIIFLLCIIFIPGALLAYGAIGIITYRYFKEKKLAEKDKENQ